MGSSYWWTNTSHIPVADTARTYSTFMNGNKMFIGVDETLKILPTNLLNRYAINTTVFASRKSVNKLRRETRECKNGTLKSSREELQDECKGLESRSQSEDDYIDKAKVSASDNTSPSPATFPSRDTVLRACTITSGLIAALGIIIRQASHVASTEGWPVLDCSAEVSFGFEIWHLELTVGLVLLVSSCRSLLLKTWPDFAESSDAANQQILTSLQPLDYLLVASLPGFSEELLFRGALLPLFGLNWESALAVAAVFGFLHLGSGRKYSFAIWATFVGLAYGYATIVSSSIIVPMVSHALNNLIGGILWRYASSSSD